MNAMNWWNGLIRQQRVGWMMIGGSMFYLLYFLKVRLFAAGPAITNKEWLYVVGMVIGVMIGTVNLRMAEMRLRNEKLLPLIDPEELRKK